MLTYLRIRDLGVIEDATLEPAPGLTVVTGETGAGKTLVVTGLGLLLGQRGDAGLVRHGAQRALIDGGFAGVEALMGRLGELGVELDDGVDGPELLVSRQVGPQGRTRAALGGLAVPLGSLTDVVGELATIHGQSEQVRLAAPERQREMLDRAAGPALAQVLAEYRADFALRRAALAERDSLRTDALSRAREADMLRFGLGEIDAVSPQPGEDEALAVEAHRLQSIDDLRALAVQADAALSGGDEIEQPGAVGLVGQARKALESLSRQDETTVALPAAAAAALETVSDLAAQVASYLSSVEADPVRLEAITARRAALQGLTRKYGRTVDEVLIWAEVSRRRLDSLESSDQRISELSARIEDLDGQLATRAGIITELRTSAAGALSASVAGELAALAMPNSVVEFRLEPLDELGPYGAESVHVLLSANLGAPAAPLAKVASGGELSRVRLALEVVLAGMAADEARQTFVFDEIDSGVGGAVGLEIGARLARLASGAQVIVVTHLAQVAAWADRHFVVEKADVGAKTTASVREVTGDARVSEVARMMGGLADSQAGLQHARDLLAAAGRRA